MTSATSAARKGTFAAAAHETPTATSTHRTSLTAEVGTSHTISGNIATSVGHAIGNGTDRTGCGTPPMVGSYRRRVANHPIAVGAAHVPKAQVAVNKVNAVNQVLALDAATTLLEPHLLPAMDAKKKTMTTGQSLAKTMFF